VRRVPMIFSCVLLAVGMSFGLSATQTSADPVEVTAQSDVNPLAARPLYVDPDSGARRALSTDPASASITGPLASTPQARWFTDSTPTAEVAGAVSAYVGPAAAAGAMPVLVVYAIPQRDCGGFSSGGLPNATAYGAWIRQVKAGIGGRPATVIVEPDALPAADCTGPGGRTARFAALADAVSQLSSDASTVVYIDAGHSRWRSPADLADRLRQVGVAQARGFSLNVSNFYSTSEEIAYGEGVSSLLGGAHYVLDTSRNGAGPPPDGTLSWCNPPGRMLGSAPTTKTAGAHADAYLWIKNPGQSDGECNRSEPASGVWFGSYAADLVQRSGWKAAATPPS